MCAFNRIQTIIYDTCAHWFTTSRCIDAGLSTSILSFSYCLEERTDRIARTLASYFSARTSNSRENFNVWRIKEEKRIEKNASSLCRNIEITLSGQLTIKIYPNWFYCPIHKIWDVCLWISLFRTLSNSIESFITMEFRLRCDKSMKISQQTINKTILVDLSSKIRKHHNFTIVKMW